MSVKNYYSFGGEILAEETGGVRRDYLTDAHGSVTATVTGGGAIENTYRYKPYGETLAKTGSGSDPNFLWSGTWGYRGGSASGTAYVRARTYHQGTGRWTSVDPIGFWGGLNLYAYCDNSSITKIDPSGLDDRCECVVRREILQWQKEGLLNAKTNHGSKGRFDYKVGADNRFKFNDRFRVHGIWLNAPEFGQYAAGYAGYYNSITFCSMNIGLIGVQFGGHWIEALDDVVRTDNEVSFWGDDGTIDKYLIMLGAIDAYMDKRRQGAEGPSPIGWQCRPGLNKELILNYVRIYHLNLFGSLDASPNDEVQERTFLGECISNPMGVFERILGWDKLR